MANSYLNIVTFLLTTVFYYLAIKKELTYEVFSDDEKHKKYVSDNYMHMAIYLALIVVIQFIGVQTTPYLVQTIRAVKVAVIGQIIITLEVLM